MSTFKVKLFIIICLGLMSCTKKSHSDENSSSEANLILPEINYFKETVPDHFCGIEGYGYIYRNYLATTCGTCHNADGWNPTFINDDLNTSYSFIKSIDKNTFIFRVTMNPRCDSTTCNLDTRGEVYQAIAEWLDHRESCN